MKATRKLIPALAMLIVAAVVMSTASYAWFTMSRQVVAEGMNVTVSAPNNLLISNAEDGVYAEVASVSPETAALQPASSVDGLNFFTTKTDTKIVSADGTLNSRDNQKLQAVPAGGAGYYKDFTYFVKTEGDKNVNIQVASVTVTEAATKAGAKALRAAILAGAVGATPAVGKEYTDATNAEAIDPANIVLNPAGTYFEATEAVASISAEGIPTFENANLAVIAEDAIATNVFSVPANGTVVQLTVRVWFEGEDDSCYAEVASNLDMDISITLVSTDAA